MKEIEEMDEEVAAYMQERMNEPLSFRPVSEEAFYKLKDKGYATGTYEEYLKVAK